MDRKNRYFTFSKISEARFRHLVRCFALDLTATETSAFTRLSVRSVNAIFLRIRQRLAEACERESPLAGTLEADESYFGPHRIRGKRGLGAGGKTIVFGLLKRGDRVYTEIVPNASKAVLQAVIRGKPIRRASFTPTDGEGTTAWSTWDSTSISGSIMDRMNSPGIPITSTGSNRSGASPKDVWPSSTGSPGRHSIGI
jgi:transposase